MSIQARGRVTLHWGATAVTATATPQVLIVPTRNDGHTMSEDFTGEIEITMSDGTTQLALAAHTFIESAHLTLKEFNAKHLVLTFSAKEGDDVSSALGTTALELMSMGAVEGSYCGEQRTAKCSVVVAGSVAGADAVIYQLYPSDAVVVHDAETNVMTPDTVSCEVRKISRDETINLSLDAIKTEGYTFRYKREGEDTTEQDYTGAVAVTKTTTEIVFSLYSLDDVLTDAEGNVVNDSDGNAIMMLGEPIVERVSVVPSNQNWSDNKQQIDDTKNKLVAFMSETDRTFEATKTEFNSHYWKIERSVAAGTDTRNLLSGASTGVNWSFDNASMLQEAGDVIESRMFSTWEAGGILHSGTFSLRSGLTYTVSGMAHTGSTAVPLLGCISYSDTDVITYAIVATLPQTDANYVQFSYTFEATGDSDTCRLHLKTIGSGCDFRQLQLECGEIATRWHVPFMDLSYKTKHNTTLIKQTNEKIEFTAEDIRGDMSKIEQKADNIRLSVGSDVMNIARDGDFVNGVWAITNGTSIAATYNKDDSMWGGKSLSVTLTNAGGSVVADRVTTGCSVPVMEDETYTWVAWAKLTGDVATDVVLGLYYKDEATENATPIYKSVNCATLSTKDEWTRISGMFTTPKGMQGGVVCVGLIAAATTHVLLDGIMLLNCDATAALPDAYLIYNVVNGGLLAAGADITKDSFDVIADKFSIRDRKGNTVMAVSDQYGGLVEMQSVVVNGLTMNRPRYVVESLTGGLGTYEKKTYGDSGTMLSMQINNLWKGGTIVVDSAPYIGNIRSYHEIILPTEAIYEGARVSIVLGYESNMCGLRIDTDWHVVPSKGEVYTGKKGQAFDFSKYYYDDGDNDCFYDRIGYYEVVGDYIQISKKIKGTECPQLFCGYNWGNCIGLTGNTSDEHPFIIELVAVRRYMNVREGELSSPSDTDPAVRIATNFCDWHVLNKNDFKYINHVVDYYRNTDTGATIDIPVRMFSRSDNNNYDNIELGKVSS